MFPINRSKIVNEAKKQLYEEIIIPQHDLFTKTWETNFGDQFEARGNEPIPTNLPTGEQPVTSNDEPSGADKNKVEYITTGDGLKDVNVARQSCSERLIDDVNRRIEVTGYVRNENPERPDSAFYPKTKEKFLLDLSKGQKMMPFSRKKFFQ